ncbi:hypothetical protein DOTSEDRAFT_24701 [Dothistroma septosporum NZE10]|uniref:F-box domain-containing protein n=1 Tax=Dothistroma septosporum (strain NZE10 / CBS 128990) TaxID=675120 RepID=N1PMP9_DOTSN|nr:hypothetical protein DOTSEDRAFT_24701 [Dothistroma septosporum NZE10]
MAETYTEEQAGDIHAAEEDPADFVDALADEVEDMTVTVHSQKKPFRSLNLPGELRNYIYEPLRFPDFPAELRKRVYKERTWPTWCIDS